MLSKHCYKSSLICHEEQFTSSSVKNRESRDPLLKNKTKVTLYTSLVDWLCCDIFETIHTLIINMDWTSYYCM